MPAAPDEKLCHCGQPLHYTDARVRAHVERMIEKIGEFVPVTVGTRTWRVPRHWIALHGLQGVTIAELGFEEIKLP
jgi:hypothetical protein